jgi:hypothetical protein
MPFATTLSIPRSRQRRARRANPARQLILTGLAYAAVVVLVGAVQIAVDNSLGSPVDPQGSAASQAFSVAARV